MAAPVFLSAGLQARPVGQRFTVKQRHFSFHAAQPHHSVTRRQTSTFFLQLQHYNYFP